MLTDFAAANGTEIWNTTRLQAYLTNVGSPFDSGPSICTCPSLTAEVLGDDPYTTPGDVAAPAPWYDANVPDSAQFLGFLPLSIEGIDDNPRTRSVSGAVGGGGIFGPVRDQPRTLTITGVIIGATCCGASYGLSWLAEAMSACVGPECDGDCLTMYSCCPDDGMTQAQFNAAYRRTFQRTALVSGPTVTRRRGSATCDSSTCSAGSELIEVEFVIVAATPWAWTDPEPALNVFFPIAGQGDCIDWCVSDGGSTCEGEPCLFVDCAAADATCSDPTVEFIAPPQPTFPSTTFCIPLVPETACYTVDLTNRPRWSEDVPIIEVFSSTQELRNVQISIYEKTDPLATCDAQVDNLSCEPVMSFFITYMPAMSFLTIDGQIGRASIDCGSGCVPATTVYGDDNGGPISIVGLNCALYCVCISVDTEHPVSTGATVSIAFSGKGL